MLDIQRISKTFNPGTVNEKKAITDLSLHLNKGEFVTVIGSNGAGKSTLFNAIAGSFYVDDGAITVGGHDMISGLFDYFLLSATATATATVAPTMGLLPMPRKPIIST